jgi:hypothetical protein
MNSKSVAQTKTNPEPLLFGELQDAAKLEQRVATKHGADKNAIIFQHTLDLNSSWVSAFLILNVFSKKHKKPGKNTKQTWPSVPGRSLTQCKLHNNRIRNTTGTAQQHT